MVKYQKWILTQCSGYNFFSTYLIYQKFCLKNSNKDSHASLFILLQGVHGLTIGFVDEAGEDGQPDDRQELRHQYVQVAHHGAVLWFKLL